jgi:hypothetical protein
MFDLLRKVEISNHVSYIHGKLKYSTLEKACFSKPCATGHIRLAYSFSLSKLKFIAKTHDTNYLHKIQRTKEAPDCG